MLLYQANWLTVVPSEPKPIQQDMAVSWYIAVPGDPTMEAGQLIRRDGLHASAIMSQVCNIPSGHLIVCAGTSSCTVGSPSSTPPAARTAVEQRHLMGAVLARCASPPPPFPARPRPDSTADARRLDTVYFDVAPGFLYLSATAVQIYSRRQRCLLTWRVRDRRLGPRARPGSRDRRPPMMPQLGTTRRALTA